MTVNFDSMLISVIKQIPAAFRWGALGIVILAVYRPQDLLPGVLVLLFIQVVVWRLLEVFRVRFDSGYRIAFNEIGGTYSVFADVNSFAPAYVVGQELTVAYLPGHESRFFDAVVVRSLLPDEIPMLAVVSVMAVMGYVLGWVGWRLWRKCK